MRSLALLLVASCISLASSFPAASSAAPILAMGLSGVALGVRVCGARTRTEVLGTKLLSYSMYAAASAVAVGLHVSLAFTVALVACPIIFAFLDLAAEAGLVMYEMSLAWGVRRLLAYAAFRGALQIVENAGGWSHSVTQLVPFLVANVETAAMAVHSARGGHIGYTFRFPSEDFAVYAVLKAAVFLALPMAEDGLARSIREEL